LVGLQPSKSACGVLKRNCWLTRQRGLRGPQAPRILLLLLLFASSAGKKQQQKDRSIEGLAVEISNRG
jgi:hypothetical protein